ncbi:hypothetical protein NL676_033352 [Syzygium grande]|nr:hypothetical protein NL676_033352 [Syzygium grande]
MLDEVGWVEEDIVAKARDEDVVALAVLVEEPIHFLVLWLITCGDDVGRAEEDAVAEAHDEDVATIAILVEVRPNRSLPMNQLLRFAFLVRRRTDGNVLHGIGLISVVGVIDKVGRAEEDAVAEAHNKDVAALIVLVELPSNGLQAEHQHKHFPQRRGHGRAVELAKGPVLVLAHDAPRLVPVPLSPVKVLRLDEAVELDAHVR